MFSTFEILVEISLGAAFPDGATPRDALDEKSIGFRPFGAKHIHKKRKRQGNKNDRTTHIRGRKKTLSPLERELQRFTQHGTEIPPSFALADLVMIQMAGNFDSFLAVLSSDDEKRYAHAAALIDTTRQHVTSAKLFPAIVQKTIESQFGEPLVAVRELAQNSIDAYDLNDIEYRIDFSTETRTERGEAWEKRTEGGDALVNILKVRDSGGGMDTETLIRDLLIPYNSAKEFDIHKIGEHGIGWYSVMDLAELVKVTTRKRDSEKTTTAIIYRDAEQWKTILWTSAEMLEEHRDKNYGTEILVHFNTEQIERVLKQKLYKHVGMVDAERTRINLNREQINTLAALYQKLSTKIVVAGKKEQLQLGVSKRRLESVSDPRFAERDAQLQNVVYTQQPGLFVNYLPPDFEADSIHAELYNNLTESGLDFWIELPAAVKLTKGRNNILPEYSAPVLDGLYKGFEQLFLDVILNDKEIIETSQGLQEGIARLFNKNYAKTVHRYEKKEFGLFRRVSARAADITNKSLDWIVREATEVYQNIPEIRKAVLNTVVDKRRKIARWSGLGTGALIGGSGIVYGAYKIYERWGWTPFIYAGAAAGAVIGPLVGYDGIKKVAGFVKRISEASSSGNETLGEEMKLLLNHCQKYLLNKMGLYVNVEEKRRLKQEKERQRIAKKYLSRMAKDEFLDKILHKKIIPAIYYSSAYEHVEEDETQSSRQKAQETLRDVLATYGIGGQEKSVEDRWYNDNRDDFFKKHDRKYDLQAKMVKLSIDDLVDAYLSRHLKYQKVTQALLRRPFSEDYVVDYNHPVVRTVVDRLEELGNTIREKYDVRVMEDYLTFAWDILSEGAMLLYCLTGAVFIHAKVCSQPVKSLLERSSTFEKLDRWYSKNGGKELLQKAGVKTVRYALQLPVALTIIAATSFYEYVLLPVAQAFDPRKFPEHARTLKRRYLLSKEIREQEKNEKNREGFAQHLWTNIISLYQTWSGQADNPSFKNLTEEKLAEIVQRTGTGHRYLEYMITLRTVDALICEALGTQPFPLRYIYKGDVSNFYVDKKERLQIDVHQSVSPHEGKQNEFELLEQLLTIRARYAQPEKNIFLAHDDLGLKAALRSHIIAYMQEHHVALTARVAEECAKITGPRYPFQLHVSDLAQYVYMSRWKLQDRGEQNRMLYEKMVANKKSRENPS